MVVTSLTTPLSFSNHYICNPSFYEREILHERESTILTQRKARTITAILYFLDQETQPTSSFLLRVKPWDPWTRIKSSVWWRLLKL